MKVSFKPDGNLSNGDQSKTWADPILGARNVVKWGEGNRWSWMLRGDFGGFGRFDMTANQVSFGVNLRF